MLRSYRYTIIALVGWLAVAGAAYPEEQGKAPKPTEQAAPIQSLPVPTPPVIDQYSPYPNVKADDCYKAENHDAADLCAQWRAAFAAEKAAERSWWGNLIGGIGIFLSLASVAAIFWSLWQTREALSHARDASVAAKRQADIAESAYRNIERAYVLAKDIKIEVATNPKNNASIVVVWENAGSTPTRRLKQHVTFAATTGPLPNDFNFADSGELSASTLVIPPRSTRSSLPIYIDSDVLSAGATHQRQLWVWAWVEYDDIFDGTPRHRTEVCVEIVVASEANAYLCTSLGHSAHNGMDAECPPERYRTIKGGANNPAFVRHALR